MGRMMDEFKVLTSGDEVAIKDFLRTISHYALDMLLKEHEDIQEFEICHWIKEEIDGRGKD
jgi:hypothetical protein